MILLALVACNKDEEQAWRQFNNELDTIDIRVVPGDPGDPVSFDLTSNTGAVTIGSASVTPGSGPVGTNHLLLLEVADEWEARIGRATLSSFGERGEDEEYTMRQDAADLGIFDLTLTSLGTQDESRTDTWTVTLWEPIDAPLVEDDS